MSLKGIMCADQNFRLGKGPRNISLAISCAVQVILEQIPKLSSEDAVL